MIRSLWTTLTVVVVLMMGLAGVGAGAQQAGGDAPQAAAADAQRNVEFPDKQELLRRIGVGEALAQKGEAEHADAERMVKIYSELGTLYEYAAMYPKAEDAVRREVLLLRVGPPIQLADALGRLATLHIAMGEPREAEKEQLDALRVRESVGDPVGTALTWNDLAELYVHQRQFKKALEYAQKAMAILADDPKVGVDDRIAVRQTMAYALCGSHECARSIPILQNAIELAKSSYGAGSLQVGIGYFVLGYVAWQNGDMVNAAEWMRRGTDRMKVELGWGQTLYVNSMGQYARFLRERGQEEAAASAEREVQQAQSVVDVRSLVGGGNAYVSAKSR